MVVTPAPSADRDALPKGDYRARFAVVASNAETIAYEMDIAYDGTWWSGKEIRDHLVVGAPQKIKL